jgi:DnaJ-class molecular chaperone
MPKIHTHYDNLKVTRNAPPEVIRAAYKTLSQKFHPDRNPDNHSATRTFQIINSAYEVLSNPVKRREHDDWIAAAEAEGEAEQKRDEPEHFSHASRKSPSDNVRRRASFGIYRGGQNQWAIQASTMVLKARMNMPHVLKYSCFFIVAAGLILFGILVD